MALKKMRLPRVHRNKGITNESMREYRKNNFRTIDREIIGNYMNAILIEVKSKPKPTKKKKKIKPINDFSSPKPIESLRNPISVINYDTKP